jgi:alpha/beta superfamily hydrolase
LTLFRTIEVPILAVIGDREESEYTVIPIRQAMHLLRAENERTEVHQIEDCDHVFTGKEPQLVDLVVDFLKRRLQG